MSNPNRTMHLPQSLVLVVDDSTDNLVLMAGVLEATYNVKVAKAGSRALELAALQPQPDIILLDVMMPNMDGYEVCTQLKANPATAHIPVIFLTALNSVEDEARAFACGAVDFITKPINPSIVMSRVGAHLEAKHLADLLRGEKDYLEQEVQKRTRELSAIQDVTIRIMSSLAETRDNETGNHIQRTQYYVRLLAQNLRERGHCVDELSDDYIDSLFKSAPLHDLGKVGIPDNILLKAGPLTAEEWVIMRTHPTLGKQSIERAESELGVEVAFLKAAKEIAYSHHEKWDGSGYPQGIKGTDIPLAARLMALADVYDALISRRIYKPPMRYDEAAKIILAGSGTHFDPDIVDSFRELEPQFREIADRFSDE